MKPFGILEATNVIASVKSFLTETMMLLASRTSNCLYLMAIPTSLFQNSQVKPGFERLVAGHNFHHTVVPLYKSWKLDGLGFSLACWSDLPTYLVVFFRITGVGFKIKVIL